MRLMWAMIAISGVVLLWWFVDGPWQNAGDTLLSHDEVRFGPKPIFSSIAWLGLVLFTRGVTSWMRRKKKI